MKLKAAFLATFLLSFNLFSFQAIADDESPSLKQWLADNGAANSPFGAFWETLPKKYKGVFTSKEIQNTVNQEFSPYLLGLPRGANADKAKEAITGVYGRLEKSFEEGTKLLGKPQKYADRVQDMDAEIKKVVQAGRKRDKSLTVLALGMLNANRLFLKWSEEDLAGVSFMYFPFKEGKLLACTPKMRDALNKIDPSYIKFFDGQINMHPVSHYYLSVGMASLQLTEKEREIPKKKLNVDTQATKEIPQTLILMEDHLVDRAAHLQKAFNKAALNKAGITELVVGFESLAIGKTFSVAEARADFIKREKTPLLKLIEVLRGRADEKKKATLDEAKTVLNSKEAFTFPIIWALLDLLESLENEGVKVIVVGLG